MGRVKEVLIDTDKGHEAVVTLHGITIGNIVLTPNDLEQTMRMIGYLREHRPFESLQDIAHSTFPSLAAVIDTPTVETDSVLPRTDGRKK